MLFFLTIKLVMGRKDGYMTNECVGLLGIKGYLPFRKIFKMDCLHNWNKDLASKNRF